MNVLITGITGMVGSHLAEYLVAHESGCDVHGLVRWRSPRDNIVDVADRITLHAGELRDLNSMVRVLKDVKPERIFHLAAQSYVDVSFQAPADTIHTNVIGTVMNQVKYKQSGSYQRGKASYSSYYTNTRVGGGKADASGMRATACHMDPDTALITAPRIKCSRP